MLFGDKLVVLRRRVIFLRQAQRKALSCDIVAVMAAAQHVA